MTLRCFDRVTSPWQHGNNMTAQMDVFGVSTGWCWLQPPSQWHPLTGKGVSSSCRVCVSVSLKWKKSFFSLSAYACVTHCMSQHSHTVEKCPHPNFLITWYLPLNKSPILTGWYPPETEGNDGSFKTFFIYFRDCKLARDEY